MSVFPCTVQTAKSVAHSLLVLAMIHEMDEHGVDPRALSADEFASLVAPEGDNAALVVLAHLVGQIDVSWNVPLTVVFHHMGLNSEAARFTALLDLCLAAIGHGVSLEDSYAAELADAERVLAISLTRCPLKSDYEGFQALAEEVYDERFHSDRMQVAAA